MRHQPWGWSRSGVGNSTGLFSIAACKKRKQTDGKTITVSNHFYIYIYIDIRDNREQMDESLFLGMKIWTLPSSPGQFCMRDEHVNAHAQSLYGLGSHAYNKYINGGVKFRGVCDESISGKNARFFTIPSPVPHSTQVLCSEGHW